MTKIEEFQNELKALQSKLNGVSVGDLDKEFEEHKERRDKYIKEHKQEWLDAGAYYKTWREEHYLSKAEVARRIGISSSTLTKYENGEPVMRANMIETAYDALIGSAPISITDTDSLEDFFNGVLCTISESRAFINNEELYEKASDYLYKMGHALYDATFNKSSSNFAEAMRFPKSN